MKIDKNYLHEMYNATSTDNGKGEIETYENWLERQLISRIEQLSKADVIKSVCVKCTDKNGNNIGNMYICEYCGRTVD
jgi:hypothetical protein